MRHRKARPQGQRRRPPLSEMRACGPKAVIEQALMAVIPQAMPDLTGCKNCVLCGRAEPELVGMFFVPIEPGHVNAVLYGICEECKSLPESLDKAEAAAVLQMEADIAAHGPQEQPERHTATLRTISAAIGRRPNRTARFQRKDKHHVKRRSVG